MNEITKITINGNEVGIIESVQTRQFNGYTIYADGRVFRPNGTEVKGYRIGKKGHIILTLGGRTVYLARLVYCLFNDLDYDAFCGQIRYYGEYSDCSLKNIFVVSKHERKITAPRVIVDSWNVRTLFCSGLAPGEISQMLNISVQRVKAMCTGFENCGMDEITKIKQIVNK